MNLEQLLQAALPAQPSENKPVGPTLLVGLGGTGKEVLLRFRRLVVERYGALSALPFVQYINVDTDGSAAAREQYDQRADDDPLAAEIGFQPNERVDLTIDGGTAKYIEHLPSYPNIQRWFPSSGKIASLGNLGDGAGQIRVASRLGLYHAANFSTLASRLAQVQGRLQDPAILNQAAEMGFQFDASGMTVIVVCSLAGGTGGGTFLDVAFLLGQYFPSAERVGILMLPSFFRDYAGGGRVRANGYAALMELSHYSFGHRFLADWTGEAKLMLPPPFTTTYLIDGINEAGLTIGSSGKEYDAYRMVSEVLFQDYSISSFAGMKRATRVNLVNFNLNVYTHNFLNAALRAGGRDNHKTVAGDAFPTRFGSFGLATITFPTDRLHSACGSRLAGDILDYWQHVLVESPLERLFLDFLSHPDVRFVQGRYERKDGGGVIEAADLEAELMVYDENSGRSFPAYFWEKAQSVRSELEATPPGLKAARLAEHRALFEQFLAKEDSDNSDEWGVGVRQVEANCVSAIERLKVGITKRAKEISDSPRLGVAYALSLLRELKTLLRHENFLYLSHFETQITAWRDEAQDWSYQLDQLQLDLSRHEQNMLFRGANLERDMERLVGDQTERDEGVLYNYLVSRVMKQVAKRGKRVCEEIDRFLGKDDPTGNGLLGEYYTLLAGFKRLRERLEAKEAYFSRLERSELMLSLYRDGDADHWYTLWLGDEAARRETLRRVGNQLLKEVFGAASPTEALAYIQRTPTEEVEARMLAACKRQFADQDRQPEALRMLFDGSRFTVKERQELVRRAFNLGKVWLAPPQLGLEHVNLPPVKVDQRPCLIGVHDGDPALAKEFKELVRSIQNSGDTPPSFQNVSDAHRGTIVFYNELAGVPAFYPRTVTAPSGMREAYRLHREKDELHTDKNRFQFNDLIPKTQEQARRYRDSLQAFALARLLGLLRVREIADDVGGLSFHYSYRRPAGLGSDEVLLGSEQHAIDFLYHDSDLAEAHSHRQELLLQAERVIELLNQRGRLWVYGLLLELYMREASRKTESNIEWTAGVSYTQYSPEFAVLSLAQQQLVRLLPSEQARAELTSAMEHQLGKGLGEEPTYEEFARALTPHCREGGKFVGTADGVAGARRTVYRSAPVLDLAKLDRERFGEGPKAPPKKDLTPASEPPPQRPCPRCALPIDARAIYCIHCQQTVAKHRPCPHCPEPTSVPDDLEHCWRCHGRMREDEKITCPRCYSFTAYADEFPCKVCGHDPRRVEEPVSASPRPAGGNGAEHHGAPAPAAPEPPEPEPMPEVECPSCFVKVPPGPRCGVCGFLLEA